MRFPRENDRADGDDDDDTLPPTPPIVSVAAAVVVGCVCSFVALSYLTPFVQTNHFVALLSLKLAPHLSVSTLLILS